ncbi:hypothetical protein [Lentzea flaviverrucosa]|uniref:Uncharacterized protein n=1 Tax=Lentzea flaviverrucosa TaxID=200379 RepID=A0A1H9RDA0_9PSEU|nr:hypothetical protein [Lentzea flaviverrucosa]RDI32960.1 hypothetical protein DFR72_102208 [Lentzea flaviverrucosa]SER70587.1 hypothetical protein SAMN05216195_106209 [Lentzea flaviverrucosa]
MTDIEQRLVKAARDGAWLECAKPDDVVRASLIRELLLGHHGELDPCGVRLTGARLDGVLDLTRVKASAGLTFNHCTIDEPITALYASLPNLIFNGGRCAGIHADSLQVDSVLFLRNGVRITGDSPLGAVRLVGAHVGADLDLAGAEITNTAGAAIEAGGIEVDGQVSFRDGVRIRGDGRRGAINLTGAHLSSDFDVVETEIANDTGPALVLDSAVIGGSVLLRNRNRISAHGEGLDLRGAHISGQFGLGSTEITSATAAAIAANSVQVNGNLVLRDDVRISGHDEAGAVNLVGGRIGGAFALTDTTITNAIGPAITADRVRVDSAMALAGRTRLCAGGEAPALKMTGAHIANRFGCGETVELETKPESAPVLDLRDTTVGAMVALPHSGLCPDRGRGTTCGHKRLVRLEHFGYTSLASGWDWEEWLHVVRCHTPAYHASAYQRLAAVERAAGHDGLVRQILMAQQTDLRRRSPQSLGSTSTRWFHWLWGALAGYGYRARRTAAALLLVLVVAGAIGWWAGQVQTRPGHLTAERVTTATTGAGTPCSTVELIGLGLDRGLPLAMTGMRARCDLDSASKKGQAFTAAIWLVQLAVWGLATLALAGYTNLVRKPG